MKKIVLIYGLIASILITVISSLLLLLSKDNHHSSEWLGYLIMIIGLSMIFVGIKQHRDKNLGGIIGFGKAFQIGLLISLIAGLFYVTSWELYYQNSDQTFIEQYYNSYIDEMRKSGSNDSEIAEIKQEMETFAANYKNFFYRILITFLEIFPVGLIISLVSSFLLKTKRSK
ncbi:MAG: DUF4199 domain-containing protein [Alcanivoracaceae bacterium]|nr:DUF4199 domain-containing protein [Alcanivoracaceae bacterium]